MKNIIIISGKQGSGKTSLTKALIEYFKQNLLNSDVYYVRFAQPLYEMQEALRVVAEKYGIPFDEKEGTLLQLLGTQWGRAVKGDDVWLKALSHRIDQIKIENAKLQRGSFFIIDDCRFKIEFYGFKDKAYTIRLECSEELRKDRADSWRENTQHQSEIDLDDCIGEFNLILNTEVVSKQRTFDLALSQYLENQNA